MNASDPFTRLPVLQGPTLLLRPLLAQDADELYSVASDPLIWEQHPDPLRYQRDRFYNNYLAGAFASGSALLVTDRNSGQIVGCSRYYDSDEQAGEVAIGFTFLARSHWGGATNRELKRLMLDYAFASVNKVWFHIGKDNWRSRKGTEKIGAVFSHEASREINGQLHEYAFYFISRDNYLANCRE